MQSTYWNYINGRLPTKGKCYARSSPTTFKPANSWTGRMEKRICLFRGSSNICGDTKGARRCTF